MPDAGERYLSVMVVNEDHYINRVFHDAGATTSPSRSSAARMSSSRPAPWSTHDPDDLAAVAAVQDQLALEAVADRPFEMPDYDAESLTAPGTHCWAWPPTWSFERASAARKTSTPCTT